MTASGGYEHKFIEEVKDFECPLCLHVTREPNLTSCCGQHFCEYCIKRIIADRNPCPFCKERQFTVLLDKKQKRKVLELKVKCPETGRCCTWTGQLSKLDAHINNECGFVYVYCPKNCDTELQRRFLDEHLSKSCPNRPFECEYCNLKDTYQVIVNKHISKCPKFPVPCPNSCTVNTFERCLLNQHITGICPLQVVDCEYQCFGCTAVVPRRDLAKHMEMNTQQHLRLMAKGLHSTQEKLKEAEGTIAFLKKRVANLEDSTLVVPLRFCVHNFSKFRKQTKALGVYTLLTHPDGYRLKLICASVLDMFGFTLKKVKSDNDSNLQWPLRCTINLTLLNQAGERNHITRCDDLKIERESSTTFAEFLKKLCIQFSEICINHPSIKYICHDRVLFKIDIVNIH